MLFIQDLTYHIAGRTLLDRVSLSVSAGQRVGLVGPNGTGKSTLFKLITGELATDGGEVNLLRGATIGVVKQDIPEMGKSLLEIVLEADTERSSLLEEAEHTSDPDRIGYIYTRLEEIEAYGAPARAAAILAGLGFDEEAQGRRISEFSGGWRARVALAAALFRQPNLLLLDEPTNHLDFEAMVWLEHFLMRYKETLILISHDRDILNKVSTHILHLDQQKLVHYTGNYDQFERKRAERLMSQQALHEKQMAQKAHMMQFVERFGAKASKARQAQSRLRMIEKMDIVDAVMADRVTAFHFPQPEVLKSPLVTLEDVSVGYHAEKPVLRKLNLRIDQDDRIALLGANGNGKSTLVKLLSGRLDPMSGELDRSSKLRIGYFAQFQTDELDPQETPYEQLRALRKTLPEAKIRAILGGFGFDKTKADTRIGELSGGEKARLLFCLMSIDAPHILLLDEPTNHLDMDAREALIKALNEYQGAVILVSHDPHLVECVADRLWRVEEGGCHPYDGDLQEYRTWIVQQRRREREQERKKSAAAPAAMMTPSAVEKELEKLEKKIADLSQQKEGAEQALSQAYAAGDTQQAAKMAAKHTALEQELHQLHTDLERLLSQL